MLRKRHAIIIDKPSLRQYNFYRMKEVQAGDSMEKRKIILDCDPGIDDAMAMVLAAAHREELEILAITTVAGNVPGDIVTGNALKLAGYLGIQAPVARGAEEPLLGSLETAAYVHGEGGLGYAHFPETDKKPVSENGILFLRNLLMELPQEEKITVAATGPLTNIALLLKTFPEVRDKIEKIVFMGGAVGTGNVTPSAEFNVKTDPEAAKIVIDSGLPQVMIGLDVTDDCYLTRKQIAKLCQSGNELAGLCGDMMGFPLEQKKGLLTSRVHIHDAAVIMYLLHPELFEGESMPVDVDCGDSISRGRTVCDARWWEYEKEEYPVTVIRKADTERFQELLIDGIFQLGEALNKGE